MAMLPPLRSRRARAAALAKLPQRAREFIIKNRQIQRKWLARKRRMDLTREIVEEGGRRGKAEARRHLFKADVR
jgi:hypothetical protein